MLLTETSHGIWDPLEAISDIRDEMNRLFKERAGLRSRFPALNLWVGENQAVVTAELPGVNPDEINVSADEDALILEGARKRDDVKEEDSILLSECPDRAFSRSVKLPFRVDADRIEAKYSKGILTLTLPRAQEDMPKRIQVKAA